MREIHGLTGVRRDSPRGSAEVLAETLAAPGLTCDLFRSAHTRRAEEMADLTATEAARLITSGDLRAEDYASCLLARHRVINMLNAVTWIDEPRVLEDARRIDQRRHRGEPVGPLAGVPLVIKDNIDIAGTPTTGATACLRHNLRSRNASVAQRLFDQGAVFFAKANLHELAGGVTTSNPATGFAANPYDPRRIPGGSSGGTAAAIAARIVPAGLGTDTAGSVRIPAALSGITALRPTTFPRRLYADDGVLPLASDLDTVGPMARTVSDLGLLHAAIVGEPVPAAYELRGLRIGIPREPYWEEIDSEVARVAGHALERLRDAGAVLIDVDAEGYYPLASEVYGTLLMHGMQQDLKRYLAQIGSTLTLEDVVAQIASGDTRALFERALEKEFTAVQVEDARTVYRQRIGKLYGDLFHLNGLSALVFPTVPVTAPLIRPQGGTASDEIDINGKTHREILILVRNTHVTGALGVPGLALPAGVTSSGLPVGLELDGLAGRDGDLLALGAGVERVLPPLPPPEAVGIA